MDIFTVFASNLVRLRNERGLTQAQLAERAELSTTTIQGYEACRQWPEKERVKVLAMALDVETLELFLTAEAIQITPSPKAVLETVADALGLELPSDSIARAKAIEVRAPKPTPVLDPVRQGIVENIRFLDDTKAKLLLSMLNEELAVSLNQGKDSQNADDAIDVRLNRKR